MKGFAGLSATGIMWRLDVEKFGRRYAHLNANGERVERRSLRMKSRKHADARAIQAKDRLRGSPSCWDESDSSSRRLPGPRPRPRRHCAGCRARAGKALRLFACKIARMAGSSRARASDQFGFGSLDGSSLRCLCLAHEVSFRQSHRSVQIRCDSAGEVPRNRFDIFICKEGLPV